nr:Chain C, Nrf2 cyclic peptide,c[GAEETGE] [synthetic construct]
GAEETGE